MDIERKMVCTHADNSVGGISKIILSSNGIYHQEELTMLNWLLPHSAQHFKVGSVYGVAIWKISDDKPERT